MLPLLRHYRYGKHLASSKNCIYLQLLAKYIVYYKCLLFYLLNSIEVKILILSYYLFFWLAILCLITSTLLTFYSKQKIAIKPFYIFSIGVFLSAVFAFIPIYYDYFAERNLRILHTILLSIHNSIRLFVVDADFNIINDAANSLTAQDVPSWIVTSYSFLCALLYVVSPILTFSFILSLFKEVSSKIKLILGFNRDVYVFSELNEKSLALAEDIKNNHKWAMIIFADVKKDDEKLDNNLIASALKIPAVCFAKDILNINFWIHNKKRILCFFAMCSDEYVNLNKSVAIMKKYIDKDNVSLYVFSTSVESEIVLSKNNGGKMKVRRINDVRSLIERNAFDTGALLFKEAKTIENSDKKLISTLVVGLGRYGTEMTKVLAWLCQMDGYLVEINVIDSDENAKSKFTALCPELMSDKYNGKFIPKEAQYKINIHSGVEVASKEFTTIVKSLPNTTYAFVALDNEALNISTSVALRTIFEQMHITPRIQTVVYDSETSSVLKGATNFSGQCYNIDFIGDIGSFYSEKVIIDSDLEAEALKCHLKWGQEDTFWAYEYNYRSSVASAIHKKMRSECGIPGASKDIEEQTPEENARLAQIEHCRWNAYMRSEGYVYSGSHEKSSRNNLGKMHHDLVDYGELSEEEKLKDKRMVSNI